MDIVVKPREKIVKMLVWHTDSPKNEADAKRIVCAVGVDQEQANYALHMLELPERDRISYSTQIRNCIQQLIMAQKLTPDCHIRMSNKVTGHGMNVYWRLANWLGYALACRDEARLAVTKADIRAFIGGKPTELIINKKKKP
jgi:hypothetical protein